ncbi:MAG TPA: hypothetical protein VF731_01325 [Solirubrobacterales bacterium]
MTIGLATAIPESAAARPSRPVGAAEACPIGHVVLNVSYTCALQFTLHGSNGYAITVSGDPEGGRFSDVEVNIDKGSVGAFYLGHGHVTPTGIHANLGGLGRISVSFRPSDKVRGVRISKRCLKHRPPVVKARLGIFVGTVSFHGEQGYTTVNAHRAVGGLGDPLAIKGGKPACDWHASPAEKHEEEQSVQLTADDKRSGVSFSVAPLFGTWPSQGLGHPGPTNGNDLFLVAQSEKKHGLFVLRAVGAAAPASAFSFDPVLTSAIVTPPAPFIGTGTFLRNADGSASWTGSLSVPLPGLGTVSLTGTEYRSELATVAENLKRLEEESMR